MRSLIPVAEERADAAAGACPAVGVFRHRRVLGRLNLDPPGALERYLERLPATAPHEGLERDVRADAGPHVAAPRYRRVGIL